MDTAKSIFSSKTFWVNLAAIIAALLEESDIMDLIPDVVDQYLFAALAFINIVLRYWTRQAVAFIAPGTVKTVPRRRNIG